MWIIIMLLLLLIFCLSYWYLYTRLNCIIYKEKTKSKTHIFITNFILLLLIAALYFTMGSMNTAVIIIHFVIFVFMTDIICHLLSKIIKKNISGRMVGVLAIIITMIYLGYGYYSCHHIVETAYELTNTKSAKSLKIVTFSDSHIGTTFGPEKFYDYISEINDKNPDVVLITGDFVDDSTTRNDLIKACKALNKLKTTYGVYYTYGNHDKGYYDSTRRGWTYEDLERELKSAGVIVLQDECVDINDEYCIIGRKDRSDERISMSEFEKSVDKNKYIIVMDHQPNDYDNQAAAQVDLVISGHTHGGQLIPINKIGELIKANDFTYGHTRIKNTDFIVNSGIGCWAMDFKTGCKSEYVIININ